MVSLEDIEMVERIGNLEREVNDLRRIAYDMKLRLEQQGLL